MIYTSYFAAFRRFPSGVDLVSIARFAPAGFRGKSFPLLAPSEPLLRAYKSGNVSDEEYTRQFRLQLDGLDAASVAHQLENTVLLCYEGPGKFCHRHIVAEWLRDHGIACQEL